MRVVILATVLLLIVGCASRQWSKPEATADDFARDKSACTYEAARASDPIFAAMFLPDCLRGRGWTATR